MTPEQFVYWLQGFMEIADPKQLDEKQTQILKDHIALVLKKETPNRAIIPSGLEEMIRKQTQVTIKCSAPNICFCPKCIPISTAITC